MRRHPSSVVIRPVPTAFLPPPVRTPASIPTVPVVSRPMPVTVDVTVFTMPVLIIVLAPLRRPSITLRLLSLVLTRVAKMAAAAVGSAALERAGAVLVAAEVRRWERLLRVPCGVHGLVGDLLRYDRRRGRMRHGGRRHHVRKGALPSRSSRHRSVAGIWHGRRSGREARRHWEALPHLVVWKRWPQGTLADGILRRRGHWRRIGHKVWPGRHVAGGWGG